MKDIPFASATRSLILASLLLVQIAVIPPSEAVVVTDLYSVEFPVPDQSRQVRNAVFSKGLEEVLIRVSGNRSILKNIEPASASAYVQQYSYAEKLPDTKGAARQAGRATQPQTASYLLKVQYNAGKIIGLLRKNGQPVWGDRRGEAVVWLAVRDGSNRYVLKDSDTSLLKDALTEAAARRGLPVIWPINDLKDQQQLRFTDLWAAFAGPVKIASRRYSKGPVIVGRLSWTGSVWKGDWSLFVDSSAYSWSLSGSDYNTVISDGVDHSADKIGKHYAVLERTDSTGPHLLVEINNVDSVQHYRKIQKFLGGLAAVKQTHLVHLDQENVVFRIDLRGDIDDFVKLVAIDRKLEPLVDSIQPGGDSGQQTVLRYSYRQ
jgi:hypothetical protein